MHIASDVDFPMKTPVPRPDYIVRSFRLALVPLVDYATMRMSIAINLAPADAQAEVCRKRLCRFFADLSSEAYARRLGPIVNEVLVGSEPWEYAKIGLWMDGKWSSRRRPMLSLLWRLNMTDKIVQAAAWLHDRGNGITLSDDDSRSDHTRRSNPCEF